MIGERIKFLREKIGITQKEMGEAIGKSWRTIQDYEYQKSTPPFRTLKMIATTYGINIKWLETGEGEIFEQESQRNYQSITGNKNIQVNSGSINQNKYDNLPNELKELINLLIEFPIPSLINEFKEKLLKYKNIR